MLFRHTGEPGNTGAVTWEPIHPSWAAVSPAQVEDAHWLAYADFADSDSQWAAGIAATMAWVRGGRDAPITNRGERPVTRELATAEMWAAGSVRGGPARTPLEAICADLKVPFVPAVVSDPLWADGAWRTLRWLTGTGGQAPPVELPVRSSAGAVLPAAELAERAIAAAPHREWLPEDRAALRRSAERQATRSQELAARIDDIRRRLAA